MRGRMAEQQRVPVGIRFKAAGKVYYFDASGFELDVGSYVVVETPHGQEVGRVVVAPDQVIVSEIKETLKPVRRLAEQEDLERAEAQKKRAAEKLASARTWAQDEGLDLRVVGGDYSLDGSQLTFYYTADDKLDTRSLARDMSSEFEAKVQLLHVGERDRAKLVDGIGRCGERLCCSSWMASFPTVSIRMAKEQSLPLNPSKLSGACGRLLCCLTYEREHYREMMGGLPKVGAKISTPTGEAKVLSISVPKETVSLAVAGVIEHVEMPLNEFRQMYGTVIRPEQPTEPPERERTAVEVTEPPVLVRQAAHEEPPVQEAPQPEGGGRSKRRRRRRRRGGRGRKRNKEAPSQ